MHARYHEENVMYGTSICEVYPETVRFGRALGDPLPGTPGKTPHGRPRTTPKWPGITLQSYAPMGHRGGERKIAANLIRELRPGGQVGGPPGTLPKIVASAIASHMFASNDEPFRLCEVQALARHAVPTGWASQNPPRQAWRLGTLGGVGRREKLQS
jgi:hypothetical protein